MNAGNARSSYFIKMLFGAVAFMPLETVRVFSVQFFH